MAQVKFGCFMPISDGTVSHGWFWFILDGTGLSKLRQVILGRSKSIWVGPSLYWMIRVILVHSDLSWLVMVSTGCMIHLNPVIPVHLCWFIFGCSEPIFDGASPYLVVTCPCLLVRSIVGCSMPIFSSASPYLVYPCPCLLIRSIFGLFSAHLCWKT